MINVEIDIIFTKFIINTPRSNTLSIIFSWICFKLKSKSILGTTIMKKLMGIAAVVTLSTMGMVGCESMSSSQQRIGAAALGGAVGGGVGNSVGGGVGSEIGRAHV